MFPFNFYGLIIFILSKGSSKALRFILYCQCLNEDGCFVFYCSVKVVPVTSIVRKAALLEGQEKKLFVGKVPKVPFHTCYGRHEERIKEPNQEI